MVFALHSKQCINHSQSEAPYVILNGAKRNEESPNVFAQIKVAKPQRDSSFHSE
jgi:hypothetical protein